jgi:hypothetical protein
VHVSSHRKHARPRPLPYVHSVANEPRLHPRPLCIVYHGDRDSILPRPPTSGRGGGGGPQAWRPAVFGHGGRAWEDDRREDTAVFSLPVANDCGTDGRTLGRPVARGDHRRPGGGEPFFFKVGEPKFLAGEVRGGTRDCPVLAASVILAGYTHGPS